MTALAGGADIIDVKEPLRGSLGRAPSSVWREVRASLPRSTPVSVALGELNEWLGPELPRILESEWAAIDYCKLGLAGAPADWALCWARVRGEVRAKGAEFPDWVAVVYLDWQQARAPHPDTIVDEALELSECRAVLFDTWSKSVRSRIDGTWKSRLERVQKSGKMAALAGSLDLTEIEHLKAWQPDIFAVRGAACLEGDRLRGVDAGRVARLAAAVCSSDESGLADARTTTRVQMSKRTP
jgi:uncharacterized protein (UPF0264 family)